MYLRQYSRLTLVNVILLLISVVLENKQGITEFPLQEWLLERAKMLGYR
jgi:hypothetical protein